MAGLGVLTASPADSLSAELSQAYRGKRVLVTGHTGFKGSWLTLWLSSLGAEVVGYALAPATKPALFDSAGVGAHCRSVIQDIRDAQAIADEVARTRPDVVFHLAAQPLVRLSYEEPVATIETNVMGTANLLEAVRRVQHPTAVVVVTSDKCYENREWVYGYREDDAMGGHDVYSMSKGAAELVTSSYRRSFFDPAKLSEHGVAVASARAGNVIGGGDWAKDRIVPDAVEALAAGTPIVVRNPDAVRPWQHVLEPLGGYLLLGARLSGPEAASYCQAWNFGPRLDDARPVRDLVEGMIAAWGSGSWVDRHDPSARHEAGLLRLAIDKAAAQLGWTPRWSFDETCRRTAAWYQRFHENASTAELEALCLADIEAYLTGAARAAGVGGVAR